MRAQLPNSPGAAGMASRWWLALPVLTLVMLAPTLLHGRPFVFWDSAQYYEYGAKLSGFVVDRVVAAPRAPAVAEPTGAGNPARPAEVEAEGTGIAFYGARSPFYSVWLYALMRILGAWAAPFTQAVAIGWLIWRVAAHTLAGDRLAWAASAAALATLGGGAWFAVGFVMPDVYAAGGLAAIALLFAHGDRMSLAERLGIAVLVTASATFHATHLVTAIAVCLGGVLAACLVGSGKGPFSWRAVLPVVSALVLAVALQIAFNAAARIALGASPKRPPFAMARIIADGPGRDYLREHCPKGSTFAVCAYRDRAFKDPYDFLFEGRPAIGVFSTLPLNERLRLIDEEVSFVATVAAHYPLSVLGAALANTIRQLALIWPAEAWMDPGVSFKDPVLARARLLEAAPFLHSCAARLGSCVPSLPEPLVAAIVILTVIAAFAVIAAHVGVQAFERRYRIPTGDRADDDDRYRRTMVFALLIVAGLIVNAAVCGGISGPVHRYQARVVWLAVIAAVMLEAARPIVISRICGWAWGRARPVDVASSASRSAADLRTPPRRAASEES